jgi:hypothetical protein
MDEGSGLFIPRGILEAVGLRRLSVLGAIGRKDGG